MITFHRVICDSLIWKIWTCTWSIITRGTLNIYYIIWSIWTLNTFERVSAQSRHAVDFQRINIQQVMITDQAPLLTCVFSWPKDVDTWPLKNGWLRLFNFVFSSGNYMIWPQHWSSFENCPIPISFLLFIFPGEMFFWTKYEWLQAIW